jgi:hypothetical protein
MRSGSYFNHFISHVFTSFPCAHGTATYGSRLVVRAHCDICLNETRDEHWEILPERNCSFAGNDRSLTAVHCHDLGRQFFSGDLGLSWRSYKELSIRVSLVAMKIR